VCHFASGILTKTNVLYSKVSDAHTKILKENGLYDLALATDFVEFELVPPNDGDWDNFETWDFVVNQDIFPSWYNPVQDEFRARTMLPRRFPQGFKKGLSVVGDLVLSKLTSLPNNAVLSAGDDLHLDGLTSLPSGAKLSAKGSLLLGNLTNLPDNVELSAGYSLVLGKLTSLPSSAKLSGGDLYLDGLTSLPDNTKLLAGGSLHLNGLTSLPDNTELSAGISLYLRKLTSLPANVKLSAVNRVSLIRLTSFPADVKLLVGDDLYLNSAMKGEKLPPGVKVNGTVIYSFNGETSGQ
jgi:hypothetical protein